MEVPNYNIEHLIQDVYIPDSGIFYFCDGFIIGEVKEGYHFTWESAKEVIELAYAHYSRDTKLAYISNRINNYSVKPQDWIKFFTQNHNLEQYGVVTYTKSSYTSAALEKFFFRSKLKHFENLTEAIKWVQGKNKKSA